jgi:hypothetical protein
MSCQSVHSLISAYLDQTLAGNEKHSVAQHLAHCRECAARTERDRQSRAMLRNLPVMAPPPELESRLRVMASHERERRLTRLDLATRLEHLSSRLRLFTDNLMRPVALPFAGGLVSALLMFGVLVPTLLFQFDFRNDISFYTEPRLLDVAFGSINDAVVELTIDEKGQVTDYSVLASTLDRQAQNSLLFDLVWNTTYTPASLLGQPISGKVTISLQRKSIVVKG